MLFNVISPDYKLFLKIILEYCIVKLTLRGQYIELSIG